MFPTTITTERLVLRPPTLEDAPAIFQRYACDPVVTRYLTWTAHDSVEATVEWLDSIRGEIEAGRETQWAICVDGDPAPSGMITAWHRDHAQTLGYVVSRELWGRGVMTEAVRGLTETLFANPAVWRVSAHAHVDNVSSQRVLEKAGFRLEGVHRRQFKLPAFGDAPQDSKLYARVRDDLD